METHVVGKRVRGGGMIYIKSLSAVESGISSKVKGIVVGMVNGYSQV